MIPKIKNNPTLLLGVYFLIAILIVGVLALFSSGGSGSKSTGGSYVPDAHIANFVNSSDLYTALGGRRQEALQKDIRIHFDDQIKKFEKPVTFTVASVTTNGSTVTIAGKYSDKLGKATITTKLLSNERMDVTIASAKKTNHDILPSNSKTNAYIATLPIHLPAYDVDFIPSSGSIVINLYTRDPALADTARATVESAIGKENAATADITVIFPSAPIPSGPPSSIVDQGY